MCRLPELENIVDSFTKSLTQHKYDGNTRFIGIRYMFDWL